MFPTQLLHAKILHVLRISYRKTCSNSGLPTTGTTAEKPLLGPVAQIPPYTARSSPAEQKQNRGASSDFKRTTPPHTAPAEQCSAGSLTRPKRPPITAPFPRPRGTPQTKYASISTRVGAPARNPSSATAPVSNTRFSEPIFGHIRLLLPAPMQSLQSLQFSKTVTWMYHLQRDFAC